MYYRPLISRMMMSIALVAFTRGSLVAQENSVLPWLSDAILAGATIRPAELLKNPHVRLVLAKTDLDSVLNDEFLRLSETVGMDVRQIEECAILFDENLIRQFLGIRMNQPDIGLRNNLRQIGLAYHNFHDVYSKFVDDDGIEDDGNKGNLSWRVYLLPFLDEAALYQEFHLDEPWDSEHNKALIERMPDVFRSPGVDDPVKTSVHVFTGEGALFDGPVAPRIRDVRDGTSNTILAILAAPETAEVWTKPGGLDVDPIDAADAIGLTDDPTPMLFADGSVHNVTADIAPEMLENLIQHQDGQVVRFNERNVARRARSPVLFVRASKELNQKRVLGGLLGGDHFPVKKDVEDLTVHVSQGLLVTFPGDNTVLAGPEDVVTDMLKKSASGPAFEVLKDMPEGEIRFAADISGLEIVGAQPRPPIRMNLLFGGEIISKIRKTDGHVNVAGESENLATLRLSTGKDKDAAMIGPLIQGLIQVGKAQLMAAAVNRQLPFLENELEPLVDQIDEISVTTDDATVQIAYKRPDLDRLITDLEPMLLTVRDMVVTERRRLDERQEQNGIRRILLAFHNYHDTFNQFPAHNAGADGVAGLSWRVHLLLFLGENQLYEQFHLDEPWDSDHNRTLIERMPDIYAVEGIKEPGHTTYHVFVGEDAPFADDREGPGIRSFTDGTSNTLLVVRAGPETAEPWTKPGGIEFTGTDILESLGTIGDRLLIALCDGSSRFVEVDELDDDLLHDLITPSGGEVIRGF